MAAEYRWVMTATGLAKRAAAETGGALLAPTQFAVGDGGGEYHEPEELVGGLVNERWRGAVNRIYIRPDEPTLVVIETIIPPDQGGWDIREAAIFDSAGDLIAVGKYPLTTKPEPGSGGAKEIIVRGALRVSNGGDVVLQIGTSLTMATQEYVAEHAQDAAPHSGHETPAGAQAKVDAHAVRNDNPHSVSKTQVGLGAVVNYGVATQAEAEGGTRHDRYMTPLRTAQQVAARIAALINSAPGALDTLQELAAAMGNDPNFAASVANALAQKQPLDPTLTALAGLVGAADRLPYFSGVDQASLTVLSAFARSLLAAGNSSSARSILEAAPASHVVDFAEPHGATSALAANRLIIRDSAGQARVGPPSEWDHIARLFDIIAHSDHTMPHGAVVGASPLRLVLRDNYGRAQVALPAAGNDIATKNYVDGIIKRYTSLPFTWQANHVFSVVHGFGVYPRQVQLVLECVVAELGYAVGDRAFNPTFNDGSQGGATGLAANTTNIFYATGDNIPRVIRRAAASDADHRPITVGNWDLYLLADY